MEGDICLSDYPHVDTLNESTDMDNKMVQIEKQQEVIASALMAITQLWSKGNTIPQSVGNELQKVNSNMATL